MADVSMRSRARSLGLLSTVGALACHAACAGPSAAPSPVAAPLASSGTPAPVASASAAETATIVEGDVLTPGDVTFRVRPLAGPGSMGPSELTPESAAALSRVQRYLEAHPEQALRVEGAINVFKTSSGPNTAYAARLAGLVTRWLVEHGIPCRRLEAVGRLDKNAEAPVEAIRFLTRWDARAPDAREDPCSAR